MGEWREVDLENVAAELTVGHVGPMVTEYRDEGVPFIRSTDIEPFRIKREQLKYINPEFHARLKKSALKPGDVVIVRTGKPGTCAMIPEDLPDANCSDVVIVRTGPELHPRYLAYYINSAAKAHIDAFSGGAVQQHFNVGAARRIRMNLPPVEEQDRIIEVLSSLDAKIDLLHRQNKTLEAMAETLFRQWFVEEAAERWEQRPLSSIASYLNGVACQKYPAKDPANRLPVLKIKELSTGITDSSDWATSEIDPKYHVLAGDVIFSWSATLMVKLWDGPKAVLNQHLFKVTSDEFPRWFYFMWTKHHVDEFVAIAESHATTFGHIKRGDLDEAMVLVPGSERLKEMTGVMAPLFEKHITNSSQIKSLTALRDTLLPKLMSGEVRVEELTTTNA